MSNLFHINKHKYNDEIIIEERHYEYYTTSEHIINGKLCYPKYRRTYYEIVGVSLKDNREITHKHLTYIDLLDELSGISFIEPIRNE